MRLIDADAIVLPDDLPYKASVKRVLMQAPTIDAVPVVHGRWKENLCSRCGIHKPYDYDGLFVSTNYCPNCGADMRERAVKGPVYTWRGNQRDMKRAWIKLQRRCPMRWIKENVKTGELRNICLAEHDGVEMHATHWSCDMESCPRLEEFMEAAIMGVEE